MMKKLIMVSKRKLQISGLKKKDPNPQKTDTSISVTATQQTFTTNHVQLYSEKVTIQSRAVKRGQAVKRPPPRKTVTRGSGGQVHSSVA